MGRRGKRRKRQREEQARAISSFTWDTGTAKEEARECSYCKKDTGTIYLHDDVIAAIDYLCATIGVEWQLFLVGFDDLPDVHCTSVIVPKQEVTSASVKNLDCFGKKEIEEKHIVATLHSHADMGVFFSSVDVKETNNSQIRTHIVVNNKKEFVATRRIDLPCGMTHFIKDIPVKRFMPPVPVLESLPGEDNISVRQFPRTSGVYTSGYGYGGYHDAATWDRQEELEEAAQFNTHYEDKGKTKRSPATTSRYVNEKGMLSFYPSEEWKGDAYRVYHALDIDLEQPEATYITIGGDHHAI